MRLLLVGSDKIYAIENFYEKYIRRLGTEVSNFTAQNYFYEYYNRSLLNKVMYRAGISGITKRINKLFIECVEQYNPDVICVFKGMEITPASLQWAAQRRVPLVNYNPDNPFIFSGAGSGNDNVKKSIGLYDLHFTYNLDIKKKLERDYSAKTFFLPFGFDLSEELFASCAAQQEIVKLCFAGNPDDQRVEFLKQLAQHGIEMDVYGNSWGRYLNHPSIKIFPPVYGDELWKVLRRYRIQLNMMRPHNEMSHNMRTFEVPGVGGIMLAPDTPEHKIFFEDGEEIFLFRDLDHCVSQVKHILSLTKETAENIRNNARRRSLNSGYRYEDRAAAALHEIEKLYA